MAAINRAEKAWINKLQKVLDECPSKRLGFYTSGDPAIGIYDKDKDDEIDAIMIRSSKDFGPTVEEVGASLGHFRFPSHVHSTSA